MRFTLSLKQSTFLTIIVASALLLLVFTHLQLTREADQTARHQIKETELSLLVTKSLLETKLKEPSAVLPTESAKSEMMKAFHQLKNQVFLLRDSTLFSKDGSLIESSEGELVNLAAEHERIREILLTPDWNEEWFRTFPSSVRSDALDTYTPIFGPNGIEYILKATVTIDNLKSAFKRTYSSVAFIFIIIVFFAGFLAVRMSQKILTPIKMLLKSTEEISKGNLSAHVIIHTGDEIEELSTAFNQMAKKLSNMKHVAEDANALTHLPGNNVISSEINKRLQAGAKIAVMHSDLDRFKIYNDSYGLQRGDEVIKKTASILEQAVKTKGNPSDLVAHEGGDDFVIVTTPSHIDEVANEIIRLFDAQVGSNYRSEDGSRGYILIKDRRQKDNTIPTVKIPLMSISLAALTNEKKSYGSYNEIASALVAMKKKAKGILGSSFAIDR